MNFKPQCLGKDQFLVWNIDFNSVMVIQELTICKNKNKNPKNTPQNKPEAFFFFFFFQ